MRRLTLCWLLAAAAFAPAADPVTPAKILWPQPLVPVTPIPPIVVAPVAPPAPDRLTTDRWYVIQSDEELNVFDSPPGKLTQTVENGPFKARGVFVDGTGSAETKTFTKKFIYFLEVKYGATSGPVELIAGKIGDKADKYERRILMVDGKPAPPPTPIDPPIPVDPPVKPPFDSPDGLRVMIVWDSNNTLLPQGQVGALNSSKVFAWLNANTPLGVDGKTREWRKYPAATNVTKDTATWQAAFKAAAMTGKIPRIAIANKDKGYLGDLPANEDALLELLAKYK